jgi:hypothetical protein
MPRVFRFQPLATIPPESAEEHAKAEAKLRQVRPATAQDTTNQQTAEQLALRIWAATVAENVLGAMSALMDELIQSHLLDDDDEEGDEGWLDDHRKREKKVLDEAIADGLDKYPDINSINNLPPSSDPDIARDAERLKDVLAKCAIGATEFKTKFSGAQIERMIKRGLESRFKKDPKYSKHVSVRTCRAQMSRRTEVETAPRPKARSAKRSITGAAAGWPSC